ncbi:MAG: phosphoribosylaminoimidazolesuccinocarboxamide synthase [Erysipelotrichaceae bacterium]
MNNLLYEGKAKKIYATEAQDEVIIYYKDDATAFNGLKKGSIHEKGILNNKTSALLYEYLHKQGIPTHFIAQLDERSQRCARVSIIPLEVITRNVIAGSCAKRLAIEEGSAIEEPIYELCYKDDALNDPLINDYHALALHACTREELTQIYALTAQVNDALTTLFAKAGIRLIDFKLEFGKTSEGNIVLADEISCDTCRLWDQMTDEKLDKDRFRRDLGNVEAAYQEIYQRLAGILSV